MNTKGQGLDENIETIPRRGGKNYLFTVAIDAYQYSPPLYNCVGDVEKIKTILQQQYQFETDHTFTLYNGEATEKNIFDTFKKLVKTIQPEDNLLILYSGHGEYEADIEEGYWIPVDAQLGDFSDYVSNSRIAKYIKAIQAHHILLIVDSCFSGSLFAHKNVNPTTVELRLDAIPSRWLLTAGRNEVVSDGKPGDHSPFADNVIYFLEKNQKTSLSVAHLINSVISGVTYNSRQTPRGEPLQDVGHRGGQFFFHRKGVIPNTPIIEDTLQETADDSIPRHLETETPSTARYVIPTVVAGLLALGLIALMFWKRASPLEDKHPPVETTTETSPIEKAPEVLAEEVKLPEETPIPKEEEKSPTVPKLSKSEKAWQAAARTDTEAAYRRFISTYPKSSRVEAAAKRIAGAYRYPFNFTPIAKNGARLELKFNQGAPPFKVRVTSAKNKSVNQVCSLDKPCRIDVSDLYDTSSSLNIVSIVVIDDNFKRKGHKLPIIR